MLLGGQNPSPIVGDFVGFIHKIGARPGVHLHRLRMYDAEKLLTSFCNRLRHSGEGAALVRV